MWSNEWTNACMYSKNNEWILLDMCVDRCINKSNACNHWTPETTSTKITWKHFILYKQVGITGKYWCCIEWIPDVITKACKEHLSSRQLQIERSEIKWTPKKMHRKIHILNWKYFNTPKIINACVCVFV